MQCRHLPLGDHTCEIMERAFSAVFSTPTQRHALDAKHKAYKQKQARVAESMTNIFKIVRQREALGNVASSFHLFGKFCLSGFAKGYIFKMMFSLIFRVVRRPTQLPPISYFLSQELFRFGSCVGFVVGLCK